MTLLIRTIVCDINIWLCHRRGHRWSEWYDVHMAYRPELGGYVQKQMRYCLRCPYGDEFRDHPDGAVYKKSLTK